MKYTICSAILSLGILVGCSHKRPETVRVPASSENLPCGLSGTIDERIADCSYQTEARQEGFVLVNRTEDLKEIHKDLVTGLLWGDRLSRLMDHDEAKIACRLSKTNGLQIRRWRLPTKEEYQLAHTHGIMAALPNIINIPYWTSSVSTQPIFGTSENPLVGQSIGWGFSGGAIYKSEKEHEYWVRCVAN